MIKAINAQFDKILDKYKIDKSTFIGYMFFLISLFIFINRCFEIIYITFVGVATTYLHPIVYALCIACPAISFSYICSSPIAKTPATKVKFLVWTSIAIYITSLSMSIQWINKAIWMVLIKIPSFVYVIEHMPEVVMPAIKYGTLAAPIFTIPWFIKWYLNKIKDDSKYSESIEDFEGKITSKQYLPTGPYTCEVGLCVDLKSNKLIKTPEKRRYESTLIQGATGTGKTATMIEPMCANDIEKKFFLTEMSKEVGYEALKSGLAVVNLPVTNEFLNNNFSLSYLVPKDNRREEYLKLVSKLLLYDDKETGKIYYKDIGLTLVAPDAECIGRVRQVAKAYNINVNYIDPLDPTSLGMNPFILEDPAQVAVIISAVLKGMYESENAGESNVFFANVTQQALENLTILLKVMYPKMHNGDLPTLEDMLKMLYDFNIIEQMSEEMKKDPILAEEYKVLIGYFERNFYRPPVNSNGYEIPGVIGSGRKDTERFIYGTITQLDNLLRHPGVKNVLCNRSTNIALDQILETGGIITVCTQKGTLANILSKAFGMFFILAFQYAVLRRPGIEDMRVPHFLYIDEFPDFLNKETETCFTQFRKYRCGMIVAIQNLSQLERTSSMKYYREVVLTNTKTQIIFGDTNYEDSKYWSDTLGITEKWKWGTSWDPSKDVEGPTAMSGIVKDDKLRYKPHKIQELAFKTCIYKTKDAAGKTKIGKGKTDFLNDKHKKPHNPKIFNFDPYLLQGFQSEPTGFFSGDDSMPFASTMVSEPSKEVDIINDDVVSGPNEVNSNFKVNTSPIDSIGDPVTDDNFDIIFDDGTGTIQKVKDNTEPQKKTKNTFAIEDHMSSENVIVMNPTRRGRKKKSE